MLKTRREFPSIGLILAGSGNPDSVRCVSPDYTAEGKDALNNLPNGVWLTNLDFAAANVVRERSGTGILHSDGWFGMDWKDLREEWRFPSELSSSESSWLARAIERSVHLSLNVGLKFTGPDTIGKHEIAGIVSHSGGLANGLAKMLRGRLAETVPESCHSQGRGKGSASIRLHPKPKPGKTETGNARFAGSISSGRIRAFDREEACSGKRKMAKNYYSGQRTGIVARVDFRNERFRPSGFVIRPGKAKVVQCSFLGARLVFGQGIDLRTKLLHA